MASLLLLRLTIMTRNAHALAVVVQSNCDVVLDCDHRVSVHQINFLNVCSRAVSESLNIVSLSSSLRIKQQSLL